MDVMRLAIKERHGLGRAFLYGTTTASVPVCRVRNKKSFSNKKRPASRTSFINHSGSFQITVEPKPT
jgi:hypothetical protein